MFSKTDLAWQGKGAGGCHLGGGMTYTTSDISTLYAPELSPR